jgi:hypothetical protein
MTGRVATDISGFREAKIWRDFQLDHTLGGHVQTVWDVLALTLGDEEITVTGLGCSSIPQSTYIADPGRQHRPITSSASSAAANRPLLPTCIKGTPNLYAPSPISLP